MATTTVCSGCGARIDGRPEYEFTDRRGRAVAFCSHDCHDAHYAKEAS